MILVSDCMDTVILPLTSYLVLRKLFNYYSVKSE